MARSLNRPQKAFYLAIAVVIAMAFMPVNWLRWVSDVAGVVTLPMAPFRHAGVAAGVWLRPPADPRLRVAETDRELLRQRDQFELLYQAADLRARELQEQLEQIQLMQLDDLRVPVRPIVASIVGLNPRSGGSLVQINRGSRHGLQPMTVAAYGGVHLVGRVTEVAQLDSQVLPITATASGYLRSRIVPRDQPETAIGITPVIQLEPLGNGTFSGEVERAVNVAVGDVVRLDDAAWPPSAQAMVIGEVDAIRPNDDNSLLKTVIVVPRYRLNQLANVMLKVELDRESGGGS